MSTFDNAWDSAVSELDGEGDAAEAPSDGTTSDEGVASEESSDETTTEPIEGEATSPDDDEPAWWEGRLDDEIQYNGRTVKLRTALDEGLMRADYTRKTQEIADIRRKAEWADNFLNKIQTDPAKTVRDLAAELHLINQDQDEYDPDEVNPQAQLLHQMQQQVEELQLQATLAQTQAELAAVKHQYPDFNEAEIVPLVIEQGENGVRLSLEQGYFLWKGQQTAQQTRSAAAKAKADEIAAKKRKAAETVQPGRSPAASTSVDPRSSRGRSFEDIFNESADELGFPLN